jgi:hypothetical protein
MKLITQFENEPVQDIKTFNRIFQSTPIPDVDESLEVEIGEPSAGDERVLKVGNNYIRLCLLQRKYPSKAPPRVYKVVAFDEKACNKCGIVKSFSEFYLHTASKGGVRADCKVCCRIKITAWNKKNKLKAKLKLKEKSEIKKYTKVK